MMLQRFETATAEPNSTPDPALHSAPKYRWATSGPKKDKLEAILAVYKPGDSARSIARKLSNLVHKEVTKNAVIGFYQRNREVLVDHPLQEPSRLKYERETAEERRGRLKEDRKRWRNNGAVVPLPVRPPAEPEVIRTLIEIDGLSRRLPLLDLEPSDCRWATHEEQGSHKFCGHARTSNSQYCASHLAASVRPTPGRTPSRPHLREIVRSR